ncbi:MAG: site-2 protease family protein, partial [Isosphaeraceae bacterium]|nr:site-2 protease family protein [Isosphaeraceae bacterium]
MSWSWKIGRIAGIPIYIHWTFLILIGWVVLGHAMEGHDVRTTIEGVVFVLAIFGCVVLHELGHALAARRYGVPTADITLLPIGGIARLQRIPDKPAEELVVALAGPAVNLVIAGSLYLAGVRLRGNPNDPDLLVHMPFLPKLMLVNLFLLLFNLLPAFPMDGGRVLRALLALRLDYAQATRIAAGIGQFMAILFGFLGMFGNPMLLLIAFFVWIGAEGEAAAVQERLMLKGLRVRDAMLTDYRTLHPLDTLGHAADLLLAGSQPDFPVVSEEGAVGVLTRDALLAGLAQGGREARVAESLRHEIGTVEADSSLTKAVARLKQGGEPCLLVVERGEPVGLLTLENIGELLMVRTALTEA